ncbi:MAG TPA: hypothetical protein PKA15_11570 [Chitinophagales bacterium]|nr:hypothetical protein [Chitinophagales bacterium]HNG09639.1 hypothetical protein [Chitinophagales bacterium]
MKYFLFISYMNNLKHNSIYETLEEVIDSVKEVVTEENLTIEIDALPNREELKSHLTENDDFLFTLSNGTWFHIQCNPVFAKPN